MEGMAGSSRKRMKTLPKPRGATTILQLDNSCLRKIFTYLNVRELIVTEKVCKKFKTMAKNVYTTYGVLVIDDKILTGHKKFMNLFEISGAEADKMFRRVGPYLHSLTLTNRCIKTFKPLRFVWQYCKNLQEIHLDSISFSNSENATKVAPALRNVKIAHLKNCLALTESHLETMFDLKHLKTLSLTELMGLEIDGSFLANLQEIEELYLNDSYRLMVDPYVFVEFCRTNPQLRILKIATCPWINATCLWGISKHLMNLECLEVSCTSKVLQNSYELLANLPNLKDFTLWQGEWDIYEHIRKLARHDRLEGLMIYFSRRQGVSPNIWMAIRSFTKLKRLSISQANISPIHALNGFSSTELEELDISSTAITDAELEMLVREFKKIRYIDVTYCENLTPRVIPKIMRHLPGRGYKLILVVKMTSISEWKMMNDPLKSDLLMLVNNWPEKYNDIYDV